MRLVRPRTERYALAALGRDTRLDTRDELPDVGRREHVAVRADLLDDLDLGRDAVAREVERLGPQADHDVTPPGVAGQLGPRPPARPRGARGTQTPPPRRGPGPLSHAPSQGFIGGEPMKPATNMFAG